MIIVGESGVQHVVFVFFFQAEDGIRDVAVTGVQTCALPISRGLPIRQMNPEAHSFWLRTCSRSDGCKQVDASLWFRAEGGQRSEERRVGKECRSRWSPYH